MGLDYICIWPSTSGWLAHIVKGIAHCTSAQCPWHRWVSKFLSITHLHIYDVVCWFRYLPCGFLLPVNPLRSQSLSFSLLWLLHEEITDGVIAGELDLHLSPALHHLLARTKGGGAILRKGAKKVVFVLLLLLVLVLPSSSSFFHHKSWLWHYDIATEDSSGFFKASTTDWVPFLGRNLLLLSTLSLS